MPDIFSLLCGIAGWFYLFYSRSAQSLAGLEPQPLNLRRQRLRRICGATMFLIGVAFFVGLRVDSQQSPAQFVAIWLAVMFLLLVLLLLAYIDVRLTLRIRHGGAKRDQL